MERTGGCRDGNDNDAEKTLKGIMGFLYEHYDGFRLLLCYAEGSVYSDFLK